MKFDIRLFYAQFNKDIQWDQCSPGNSASHYSDQSMMKLDFLATSVVLDFPKEVPKIFFFLEISILCDKNPLKRP